MKRLPVPFFGLDHPPRKGRTSGLPELSGRRPPIIAFKMPDPDKAVGLSAEKKPDGRHIAPDPDKVIVLSDRLRPRSVRERENRRSPEILPT
ncbi:MAG: hypothetical protein C6W57_04035 [Caldibacillus debilis]|nr:MAG: hypothetical protein C6W57_04035 [Caldibacillus debilis]